ncbi:ATP-binding protein [Aerosakkonemataceae cyanobacterium BLCC-F154]|uniref:histidine kinase n=1 Tax=Floridaenema fluviatile BLCC-F154 TaxID=3153640 RepID=A0ABV4YB50_9CYAN
MSVPIKLQNWQEVSYRKSDSAVTNDASSLQGLGSELVYVQEVTGQYLSFYWQEAERYQINSEAIVNSCLNETFGPVAANPYLEQIQQILDNQLPERFCCEFQYQEHKFKFDLIVSPILVADESATKVLVMGRQVQAEIACSGQAKLNTAKASILHWGQHYKKLIRKISRHIRRTLDLDTIWQRTVDDLGKGLNVSRCVICAYKSESMEASVKAEYRSESVSSLLGQKIKIAESAYFTQTIETLEPNIEQESNNSEEPESKLAVATFYQDKPNGLIVLYDHQENRQWSNDEIELMRELADLVGSAIAHATLYHELEQARQQAEEASRLKSEFLANTSHELRTPLNGMLGFLKLVLEGMADDPKEQMEFIQEAYRSALHLLDVINDILDIAKIEAGKMELELGPVVLEELLSNVEDFTKTQAQQKNLSFRIQKPATRDKIILNGNYQRLLQVLLNLVGNAIKFTHEGGVMISAEVQRKKSTNNQEIPAMAIVRVVDTGIGVSLEKQGRLFQSFSQVNGGHNRQYGGTGLGLYISQKLIEAMKGEVEFYSMGEGLGSTVTFTVPLYQDPVLTVGSVGD